MPDKQQPSDEQQRRQPRATVNCTCDVRVGQRQWHQARLLDLTTEGFRLALTDTPAIGTVLRIRLPGISIMEAEVCWARNFEAGCRFIQPLSPYVFEHFVRQAGS
ncbi:PilZ domain-containing protein [Altererythrobacter sp. KTW20L]|uniref:PilZ domain-containing protein n=1 Tax=Altererythrobacter sp. KTW20L TaxID=2942210 RepID=UPI0020BDE950|nr:PilZ domain-containing protein [Altererythrobacter sp. KTW20L]MCL6250150.1 PilZ domain-containing protein [Altererythrobacter sp. KTW20L]